MKPWVLLLGCLLVVTSQAQTRREVWQWRDENGVTHFSDYPAARCPQDHPERVAREHDCGRPCLGRGGCPAPGTTRG